MGVVEVPEWAHPGVVGVRWSGGCHWGVVGASLGCGRDMVG